MMSPMKRLTALLVCVVVMTSGCGLLGPGDSTALGKCVWRIKADDVVFTSYGETQHAAQEYGDALEAECEDTGADARGSVFTESSRAVTTYRFEGYPPSQVLGVTFGGSPSDGLGVFMSDSVSADERERILRELGPLKR